VAGSDDSYLCDNDLTLAGALEADQKKVAKKSKKAGKTVTATRELLDSAMNNKSTKDKVGNAVVKIGWYVQNDFGEILDEGLLSNSFEYTFGDDFLEDDEVNESATWEMMEDLKSEINSAINPDDFSNKLYTFFNIESIETGGNIYQKDDDFEATEAGRLYFDPDNGYTLALT